MASGGRQSRTLDLIWLKSGCPARYSLVYSHPGVAALSFGCVVSLGGIVSLAEAKKEKMSKADHIIICRGLESLEKSTEAAMLIDQQYEALQKICADARSAADKGDFDEAKRLFVFAHDLLEEEGNISGTE